MLLNLKATKAALKTCVERITDKKILPPGPGELSEVSATYRHIVFVLKHAARCFALGQPVHAEIIKIYQTLKCLNHELPREMADYCRKISEALAKQEEISESNTTYNAPYRSSLVIGPIRRAPYEVDASNFASPY